MAISRRTLVRALGTGVLGAGALSACTDRGGGPAPTGPAAGALTAPDQPLVVGQIGASYGRMAQVEAAIAAGLDEARIDINARWDGLFGHQVELTERHVMTAPGEDLTGVIATMAEAGVTCVITSIDEESLTAAMPALVEAGMAIIDVLTTGMGLRSPEVQTANLLLRVTPNDRTMASRYAETALASTSDSAGPAGTVAYLSEDTQQGRSLLTELELILNPRSGRVLSQQFHPVGDIGDVAARVRTVLQDPPALLVVNSGPEAAPFFSALYEATLDEDGRPEISIPIRLSPAATVDYAQLPAGEGMAADCLGDATGYEPGGEITPEHRTMMANRDPSFLQSGMAYSQQAYDALTMACLAAQHALSLEGTALAGALPTILTGTEECTDYEMCSRVMTTALQTEEQVTISFTGRMGALELGPRSDARIGQLREYTWSEANERVGGEAESFEAPA